MFFFPECLPGPFHLLSKGEETSSLIGKVDLNNMTQFFTSNLWENHCLSINGVDFLCQGIKPRWVLTVPVNREKLTSAWCLWPMLNSWPSCRMSNICPPSKFLLDACRLLIIHTNTSPHFCSCNYL